MTGSDRKRISHFHVKKLHVHIKFEVVIHTEYENYEWPTDIKFI